MTLSPAAHAAALPVLLTQRLRLRAPALADFDHWAAFFASERSVHEGGPKDRQAAWEAWASTAALWLLKGYGAFGVEDRQTGAYLGEATEKLMRSGVWGRRHAPNGGFGG